MNMNEPVGDPMFAPLLIRAPLGAFFALAGWSKLDQLAGFVKEVKQFGILPDNIASLYGTLLPYLEIGVGILLFLGLWTTLAAILGSLLLLSFIFAVGFATGHEALFNKDVILLTAMLSLVFTGCGRYGVDNVKR
jgi:uncharacterized membrane protein YphA (DoxX/SURF4 family)